MENLRKLLGKDWINREVLCAEPTHLLGRWYRKNPENPVTRHIEQLLGYVLNNGAVRSNLERLAAKIKGEFLDTLVEIDYAVFLGKAGFQVTMEPSAPNAGPDLLAVRDFVYFIEIKRVRLDEARAAADAGTEDVFRRVCHTPSRYSIIISMTDEYRAYSPQLKRAVRAVHQVLKELGEKGIQEAALYYRGPDDYALSEGPEREPQYDYLDKGKLAAQMEEVEQKHKARFVARFSDTGADNASTLVAVHPLGTDPHLIKPDETYLRLRGILKKKREQLPQASRGVVVLDITDLEKLMVDQETIERAVYGDLVFRVRRNVDGSFQDDLVRTPNGFFMQTSRVSAVVAQQTKVTSAGLEARREVFPTSNPQGAVLSLNELALLGQIATGLEHLCAERLREDT